MKPVPVARKVKARQVQRALLQYFKPENWFEVRNALVGAGRLDLIGDRPECLIPARPPRGARDASSQSSTRRPGFFRRMD
jgi:hypothetical protein